MDTLCKNPVLLDHWADITSVGNMQTEGSGMATRLLLLTRHFSPPVAPDRELLDRFRSTRDNEAFSELVRRHGPIVYRICRRLVGSVAADDAFQATFLLLATRTTAATAANSVASWLVGVAGRVARQMLRAARRRSCHESIAASRAQMESVDSTPDLRDQFCILDEELARLPDRLRDPLVSCLLQGHTQEEAAAASGHTTRTVRRRLEEAKRLLRVRLLRRGVTPAVAAGFVAGLESVTAALPPGLATRTVAVVFDFLTGGSAIASPPAILAKGVTTTMLARKVMVAMVAVAVGLTSLGMVLAEDSKSVPNPPYPMPPIAVQSPSPQPVPGRSAPQPFAPAQPLPNTVAKEPANNPSADVERQIKQLEKSLKAGERQVLIEAMCVEVPAKFSLESGLIDNATDYEMIVNLNRREAKMLEALINANPDKQLFARPQIFMSDGQPGVFQVGTNTPSASQTPVMVSRDKSETVLTGAKCSITPRIDKNSDQILLRIETWTAREGLRVERPTTLAASVVPLFDGESMQTTVKLLSGETAVIGKTIEEKTKKTELLWILTPHLVQGKQ